MRRFNYVYIGSVGRNPSVGVPLIHNRWIRVARCARTNALWMACSIMALEALPAQQTKLTAVVGAVSDSAGNPLENAEILIGSLRRLVRSQTDGSFRFENVKPGTYEVVARRLGYFPQVRAVTVTDSGGRLSFSLVPSTPALPPVVTAIARGGLSGIVGDTAYRSITGAEVTVISGGHRTATDSAGQFFLDLKPGRFMLQVSRPGFASRIVSVTIPSDSGRRIVVWLTPASRGATARQSAAVDGLKLRLDTAHVVWSKLLTHEDVVRLGMTDVMQVAAFGAGQPLASTCSVLLDGGPDAAPLWSIDPEDIEAMEVYTHPPTRGSVTSILGNDRIALQKGPTATCNATIYVWLRR